MVTFVNRAKMTTATTGTGAITLGPAASGYQSFAAAGVSDADTVRYVIEDGTAWEIGTGTYTASGTSLARSVEESSNSDAAINLSGSAVVYVTAVAADLDGFATDEQGTKADNAAPVAGAVTLTGGFDSDEESLGTITSGTVTPEVDGAGEENFKTLTNNGAFTLSPPSSSSACVIRIHLTNAASAGAITTSGFDAVYDPDGYVTDNAKEYFFYIDHSGTRDVLTIREIV